MDTCKDLWIILTQSPAISYFFLQRSPSSIVSPCSPATSSNPPLYGFVYSIRLLVPLWKVSLLLYCIIFPWTVYSMTPDTVSVTTSIWVHLISLNLGITESQSITPWTYQDQYYQTTPSAVHSLHQDPHPSQLTLLSLPSWPPLWNCWSAVNKPDFIPAFASQSELNILAVTETWITTDNAATPSALFTGFSLSHTPRPMGQDGRTGLLSSTTWKFSSVPCPCNYISFEHHALTVTNPVKLNLVAIYCPPGQQATCWKSFLFSGGRHFIGNSLWLQHPLRQISSDWFPYFSASFDLTKQHTPATHKASKEP